MMYLPAGLFGTEGIRSESWPSFFDSVLRIVCPNADLLADGARSRTRR